MGPISYIEVSNNHQTLNRSLSTVEGTPRLLSQIQGIIVVVCIYPEISLFLIGGVYPNHPTAVSGSWHKTTPRMCVTCDSEGLYTGYSLVTTYL